MMENKNVPDKNVPEGWDHAWDCQSWDASVPIWPQKTIDANLRLSRLQVGYRLWVMELKNNNSWPSAIETRYGTSVAFGLGLGLSFLQECADDDFIELVRMPDGALASQVPGDKLCRYLPPGYKDRYDLDFVKELDDYIESFRKKSPGFTRPESVMDEIIVYMCALFADRQFGDLFVVRFRDWVYDTFGWTAQAMLYDFYELADKAAPMLGADPEAYAFGSWFKNRRPVPAKAV